MSGTFTNYINNFCSTVGRLNHIARNYITKVLAAVIKLTLKHDATKFGQNLVCISIKKFVMKNSSLGVRRGLVLLNTFSISPTHEFEVP